jgi:predicted Na+-dependent transporter
MGLPLLAGLLFAVNHQEWLSDNTDYVLPIALVIGLFLFYKIFPELWESLKTLIPIMLLVVGIIGGVMYLIFGGGADSINQFGAKAREQHIESLR